MVKLIYTVFDVVAGQQIGPLLLLPNDGVARRAFQDALLGDGSNLASHPSDYVLLRVGSMDVESCVVSPGPGELEREIISGDIVMQLQSRGPEVMNG